MGKRRYGHPSESRVKRGDRVVHGNKELIRKAWTEGSVSMWFGTPLLRTVAYVAASSTAHFGTTTDAPKSGGLG
jgi:hypothetical protein